MRLGKYSFFVIVIGFGLSGYMVYTSPSTAAAQIPIVLGLTMTLAKLFDTDAKIDTAAAKVDAVEAKVDNSVSVSEGNSFAIATVAEQTAHALEQQAQQATRIAQQVDQNTKVTGETHEIVNSQRTAMEQKIERLEQLVTVLVQEKITKESSNEQTGGGLTRIAEAIEQVVPVIAPPPKDTT